MKHWQFVRLSARLRERANQFLMTRLGVYSANELAPCDGDILQALYREAPLRLIDIAKRTNRSKSTVSVLVDRLEALGYLQKRRSDMDARALLIDLTEKGRHFEPMFGQITEDLMHVMTSGLKDEELETAERVLNRLLDNLPES